MTPTPQMQDAILDALPACVVRLDTDGSVVAANRRWREFVAENGLTPGPGDLGGNCLELCRRVIGQEETCQRLAAVWRGETESFSKDFFCHAVPGTQRWLRMLATPLDTGGAVVMLLDISEQKEAERRADRLTHYDALTGLPNRVHIQRQLRHLIAEAQRADLVVAVLMLDIDRFMMINDTLGHQKGDRVLQTVGERLSHCIRGSDTVGRWQGDEFVVVLAGLSAEADAADVARKLQETIGKPLRIDEMDYTFSASIGISFFPKDGDDEEFLLKKADMAMYRAKENGKNTVRFYASEQEESASHFLEIEQELRLAMETGQLELHYQPQVELEYGRIAGFEALIRWRHPVKGLVCPADFLSIAEDARLMDDIGTWVVETACAQCKAWQEAGLRAVRVAVNISPSQFQRRPLAETIAQALHKARLEAKYLEIEVTEGLVMRDMEETVEELERIRTLGVHIAIDDFGTGYSSLSYLKRFPVHTVKIDQSFVRDIHRDPDDAAIVKAVIAIARSLRLHVVAEGVETESHLAFLVRHGCDTVQGYLFSPAVPAKQAGEMLSLNRCLDLAAAKKTAYQRTLLVVDDEANIRSSLTRLLRQEGYRILSASSGAGGLELLAANDVGVIVSDQRMPEMTGVEFLKKAKQLYPETIRLVLSGYTDLNTVTDAINEGAIYKFLTKPWDDELLRANIREAFEHYETAIENERLHREIDRINDELKAGNLELETRVQQKTGEIMRGLNLLHISREILEYLPVGIVGADESGLIVVVNREAERIFRDDGRGALIGSLVSERLPAAVAGRIGGSEPTPPGEENLQLEGGRNLRVWYHRMGEECNSQGIVMVVAEKEQK